MGLNVYRFTFLAGGRRFGWLLFDRSMESALSRGKQAARGAFAGVSGFMIESDQQDDAIRRRWGIKRWNT